MTKILHSLGGLAHRHRVTVVGAWLLLLLLLGGLLGAVGGNDLQNEYTVPGSESQSAIDTLDEEFPGSSGASGQLLLEAPPGTTINDPAFAEGLSQSLADVGNVDGVTGVVPPSTSGAVSEDGMIGLAQVQFEEPAASLEEEVLHQVEDAMAPALDAGLDVRFGGNAFDGSAEMSHASELVSLGIALVVLMVTLGSVLAAGLPLVTALAGVGVGLIGIWLASTVATVSTTAPTLAMMLGLAVGIDYALLIVVRHRAELARGHSVRDAVIAATRTAGTSVVFAGLTVMIGVLGLAVAGVPFVTTMGLAAAGAVAVAVLVAITLLPALLSLAGERLRPRSGTATGHGAGTPTDEPAAERWVKRVIRRPVLVLVTGALALGALAVPAFSLDLALSNDGQDPAGTDTRVVYDTVADTFGPGVNGKLLVLADLTASADPQAALNSIAADIGATDSVASTSDPRLSPDGDYALMSVTPETGPSDPATTALVQDLRDQSGTITATTGADIEVAGATALAVDVSSRLSSAIVPFALVAVGLCFVLLTLIFRSLVVPLIAALGYLLSLGAALGSTVAVFQWGWLGDGVSSGGAGPLISFLPILVMAVLLGLAMDYQVFLVSRIHEAVESGRDARSAIREGAGQAGRVVVAAALIMISVFAGFAISGNSTIRPMAFALAIGVFADAFVVRLTLVPAALGLLGDRAWQLPRWLDRVLPHVDVEGGGTLAAGEDAEAEATDPRPPGAAAAAIAR